LSTLSSREAVVVVPLVAAAARVDLELAPDCL
jgi:hypothetical protein